MLISVNMSHGFKPKDYSLVLTDAFLPLPFFAMPSLAGGRLFGRILFYKIQLLDRKKKKFQCAVMGGKGKPVLCLLQFETLELVS